MTKINLVENKKIMDFSKEVTAKLDSLKEESIRIEKDEAFKSAVLESYSDEDDEDEDSEDEDDSLDWEADFDDGSESGDYILSDEEEAELMKEFEDELDI